MFKLFLVIVENEEFMSIIQEMPRETSSYSLGGCLALATYMHLVSGLADLRR